MKILIVDDNPALVRVLRLSLDRSGYETLTAANGLEALKLAREHHPDLVVLDVLMPVMDGWETCDRLRTFSEVPIIFLTARGGEPNVVRGLTAGADDYLIKPFSPAEFMARVEAVMRRVRGASPPQEAILYDDGVLRIDTARRSVSKRGQEVVLSPKEFKLLACLLERAGEIVSHEELLREVWGADYQNEQGYLALYVHYLRQKLEDDPSQPRYIHTQVRAGYRFGPPA